MQTTHQIQATQKRDGGALIIMIVQIVVPQQQMQPQGSQRHEQQQPNRQVPNQMGRQGSARVAPPHRPPNQAKAQPLQMPPSQGHPLQMQPTSQQRSQAGQSTQAPAAQAKQPSIGQFIHGPLPQTLQQGRPLPTTIVPHQSKVQRRSGKALTSNLCSALFDCLITIQAQSAACASHQGDQ